MRSRGTIVTREQLLANPWERLSRKKLSQRLRAARLAYDGALRDLFTGEAARQRAKLVSRFRQSAI